MSVNNKPELPEIFPTTEVSVDRERHEYMAAETDSGFAEQYEYTLNKAPIERITEIEGVNRSGQEITFSEGSDYVLEPYVDTLTQTFEYTPYNRQEYQLSVEPDYGSVTITDTSDNSYTESSDFRLVQGSDNINTFEWKQGERSPNDGETFTLTYRTSFTYDSDKRRYVVENIPQDGSMSITDSNDTIYQLDQQFDFYSNDDDIETIKWDISQSTPEDGDSFTYIYEEQFTYDSSKDYYKVRRRPDFGSVTIKDSDSSYVENSDYEIIQPEYIELDTIEWVESGNAPSVDTAFTVVYDLTYEQSVLRWKSDADNLPERNSYFYVSYVSESIISRFLEASGEQLDIIEDRLDDIIEKKFIDSASGKDLDRLGALFGDVIGKRSGRDDTQYRIYLKSVVRSFVSRGTKTGIKIAVSAATAVPLENITIREDFNKTAYDVVVIPNNPVQQSVVEQIAEIADPSGVELLRVRFSPPPDVMVSKDGVSKKLPESYSETMQVNEEIVQYSRGARDQLWEENDQARTTEWNFFSFTGVKTKSFYPKDSVQTTDNLSISVTEQENLDKTQIIGSILIGQVELDYPISDSMQVNDNVSITVDIENTWEVNNWESITWQ